MRKILLHYCWLICATCIVSIGTAKAQSLKTVEIDTISSQPKTSLPFDESFILKAFVGKNETVKAFSVREVNRNGEPKPTSLREYNDIVREQYNFVKRIVDKDSAKSWRKNFKCENSRKKFQLLDLNENFKTFQRKNFQELYMNVQALDPSSNYEFILMRSSATILNELVNIVLKIVAGDLSAQTDFDSKVLPKIENNMVGYVSFADLQRFATDASVQAAIGSINASLTTLSTATPSITLDNSINELLKPVIRYDDPFTEANKDINKTVYDKYNPTISVANALRIMSTTQAAQMQNGLIKLKVQPFSPINLDNYVGRKKNLEGSIAGFNQLIDLTDFLILQGIVATTAGASFSALRTNFISYRTELIKRRNLLNTIISSRASITSQLEKFDILAARVVSSTTSIQTFKARYKLRIVPDFGFAFMWDGGNLINDTGLVPYIGFHINLRPINKDIPFKTLKYKRLWHYLSFTSGITTNSVKIEGQRSDFFDDFSLLTGFGFRLNNAFRVVGGTVWFKKIDPNPLVDKTELAFSPYAAISVDFELQEFFGGIKNLFSK